MNEIVEKAQTPKLVKFIELEFGKASHHQGEVFPVELNETIKAIF